MVHIREDAAGGGERNEHQHDKIKNDAKDFGVDIPRKSNHNHEKNRSDNHGVGRRKAGFTGAVWTGGEYNKFIENNVDGDHQNKRDDHSEKRVVNFFERFAGEPLVGTEAGENSKDN